MKLSSFQIRIRFVIFSIFVVALVLITRLFFVQVIHSNSYVDRADKQYITPSSNIFNRGGIFFSKKDGSLVAAGTVISGFKLAIVPKEITDAEDAYIKLDPYMEIDEEAFLSKVSKTNDPYEEIAEGLSKEQITEIEN